MTWEQKLYAASKIGGEISLRMRTPGDWYVSHPGIDFLDAVSSTSEYGNGNTPEAAVENHWKILTNEASVRTLRSRSMGVETCIRWNGFMWEPVENPWKKEKP